MQLAISTLLHLYSSTYHNFSSFMEIKSLMEGWKPVELYNRLIAIKEKREN